MSNEAQTRPPSPEELARIKRQLTDRAVKLAVASQWDEALAVNREYVRLFPRDSEGYNRLGKSLAETGALSDAREAYNKALELDPTNTIAKRNLERLSTMEASGKASSRSTVDTTLFVEETGKAAVAQLQAVDRAVIEELDAGDLVELSLSGNAVNVLTNDGRYIGMIEPRIGLRMSRLIAAGNVYAAALLNTSGDAIRVIIRETYQHPSQAKTVSFPQSKASDFRPYVRSSALRRIDRLAPERDDGEDDDDYSGNDEENWEDEDDPRGMRIVNTNDLDGDDDDYD